VCVLRILSIEIPSIERSDSKVRYIGFVTFVEGSSALFTMKAYPGQYETVHNGAAPQHIPPSLKTS